MTFLPNLPAAKTRTEVMDAFDGYDRTCHAPKNALADTENLSPKAFPRLAARPPRRICARVQSPSGLLSHGELCYTDGGSFVFGDRAIPMGLTAAPKQLVSFGEYVVILPDRKYVRPADGTWGEIDAVATSAAGNRVTLTLCRADGSPYPTMPATVPPSEPLGGELWLDTSPLIPVLYRFAPDRLRWEQVSETYLRLQAKGIGKPFRAGDNVTLGDLTPAAAQPLCRSHTLTACGEDYLVFRGILPHALAQNTPVTAVRKMPETDFLISSGGRLWSCFRGTAPDGTPTCHIRASRRGDFRNWEGGEGDGAACEIDVQVSAPFTAAFDYLGTPTFFTEQSILRITGNTPATFRAQLTLCEGVEQGGERSLALLGKALIYQSPKHICSYHGDLPTPISAPLGETDYRCTAAGADDRFCYLALRERQTDVPHLFVYDARSERWLREDSTPVTAFANHRGRIYFTEEHSGILYCTDGEDGIPDPAPVRWMLRTHPIANDPPHRSRISRIDLRLRLPLGSRLDCYIEYDSSGEWHHLHTIQGEQRASREIPLRPRACDHLCLRFVGEGEGEIEAIAVTMR